MSQNKNPNFVLELRSVHKRFAGPRGKGLFASRQDVHAVDDVNLCLQRSEVLGSVGESGCGKSTVARLMTFLYPTSEGEVIVAGQNVSALPKSQVRKLRRDIQIVFQDPHAALNPRFTVFELISEAWKIFPDICPRKDWRNRAAELLKQVGLRPSDLGKYPSEFSGGQRQRICIARALSMEPTILVCDEPVSALDVSVQAQVLNLLQDLQEAQDLSIVFISHDLSVVRHVADRVAVMYLGQVVELGSSDSVFENPQHPYTQALLSVAPSDGTEAKRDRIVLSGEVPSPIDPPQGCKFHTRCWKAIDFCKSTKPMLVQTTTKTHQAACHLLV